MPKSGGRTDCSPIRLQRWSIEFRIKFSYEYLSYEFANEHDIDISRASC